MTTQKPRILKRVLWLLVLAAFIAGTVVACQERQAIRDYFDGLEFTPTAEMSAVIDHVELTDTGRRVMHATHPAIESADAFNDRCRSAETNHSGHLLGCYTGGKIHLFSVTDERLSTVVEVTAVHELMHAVFARMTTSERDELTTKLTALYEERITTDEEFAERMSVYSSLSPAQFANELHSVFATEVTELPEWLEQHYSRWLTDRQLVVGFFDTYQSVFATVEREAKALKEQLDEMHESLEAESADYSSAVETFNHDWTTFVDRNNAYEFSGNAAEFNRLKDEFDVRRQKIDSWKDDLQRRISEYESLSDELASLGELSLELNSHIDSTISETP